MTRINSAIPVKSLTDEHLLAEHREIIRLPNNLSKSISSGSIKNIPLEFCLGSGHVLFFLDKMMFVKKRYYDIHNEAILRGFNIIDYSNVFDNIPIEFLNDYEPTGIEHNLLVERISNRLLSSTKKYWHYYGKQISKQDAVTLL